MERNDAVMPMVAIVVAAIMWIVLLGIFNASTHVPKIEVSPELKASAEKVWPTLGKEVYETAQPTSCAGCHGTNGEGTNGPALAGNQKIIDNPGIVINNIRKGKLLMPAYPDMPEDQLLAVTNYIRNAWGNKAEILGPDVLQEASSATGPEVLRVRSRFVPENIHLPEIFLATFVMLLLTYGIIGLYSVWAEGVELHPGIHKVRSTPLAVMGMVGALGSAVLFAVLFARQIILGLQGVAMEPPAMPQVTAEGTYAAMIFLSLAAALGIYKKYFMDGEALVEDASGEFPW